MAQAEEEVGFKPPQFALELQIMVLPDQGMVLIFSEKTPEDLKLAKGVMECLGMIKDSLGLTGADISNPDKPKEMKQAAEPVVTFAVFAFHSISDICNYARVLPGNLRVKSELYQMDGVYYLFLDKGSASYERYSRACIRALEFGSLYTAEESTIEHIREHGECLIADHAVKKMRL